MSRLASKARAAYAAGEKRNPKVVGGVGTARSKKHGGGTLLEWSSCDCGTTVEEGLALRTE